MRYGKEKGDFPNGCTEGKEEPEQVFLVSCWPLIMLYSRVQALSGAPSFLHPAPPIMPPLSQIVPTMDFH